MIPAQSRRRAAHLPQGIAELRATEVYVRALCERVTLLAADQTKPHEQVDAELCSALTACSAARVAIRPALKRFDPGIADTADIAADLARQRAEAELQVFLGDTSASDASDSTTTPLQ